LSSNPSFSQEVDKLPDNGRSSAEDPSPGESGASPLGFPRMASLSESRSLEELTDADLRSLDKCIQNAELIFRVFKEKLESQSPQYRQENKANAGLCALDKRYKLCLEDALNRAKAEFELIREIVSKGVVRGFPLGCTPKEYEKKINGLVNKLLRCTFNKQEQSSATVDWKLLPPAKIWSDENTFQSRRLQVIFGTTDGVDPLYNHLNVPTPEDTRLGLTPFQKIAQTYDISLSKEKSADRAAKSLWEDPSIFRFVCVEGKIAKLRLEAIAFHIGPKERIFPVLFTTLLSKVEATARLSIEQESFSVMEFLSEKDSFLSKVNDSIDRYILGRACYIKNGRGVQELDLDQQRCITHLERLCIHPRWMRNVAGRSVPQSLEALMLEEVRAIVLNKVSAFRVKNDKTSLV
jgi:hypothetical protein